MRTFSGTLLLLVLLLPACFTPNDGNLTSGVYKTSVVSPILDHEKARPVSDIQFLVIE